MNNLPKTTDEELIKEWYTNSWKKFWYTLEIWTTKNKLRLIDVLENWDKVIYRESDRLV